VRVLVTGASSSLGAALVRRLGDEAVARDDDPLDACIHIPAAGPGADPTELIRTNVLGTQLVLDAARAAGAKRLAIATRQRMENAL